MASSHVHEPDHRERLGSLDRRMERTSRTSYAYSLLGIAFLIVAIIVISAGNRA